MSNEIKTHFEGASYDDLSPLDRLLYRQYMDRLEGANCAEKERRHRDERICFVAVELLRRRERVFPQSVKLLYRELFECSPQWGPAIYSSALRNGGWTYISRAVGYLREGIDYEF